LDTEAWLDCWGDRILRQYLIDVVRAFSTDPVAQEDLLTTAWLYIGDCEYGCTTEYLMDVGFRAMMRLYKAEYYQPRRKRWHEEPIRYRVQRLRKKYFCIVHHPPVLV